MTTATDVFWEDDPEEVLKKRVNELKRKFHNGRQLQIKHLPRDVMEEVSKVKVPAGKMFSPFSLFPSAPTRPQGHRPRRDAVPRQSGATLETGMPHA